MGNINRIVLGGTITQPQISMINSNNGQQTKVARFVMQIARDFGKQGEFDNVSCIAYGKQAEFVEQQFASGNAALVVKDGRIQTGSYTDQAGKKVYTTDVVCSNVGLGAAYLNKSILSGNLTKNPEVRYTQGQEQTCIVHFTIAVKRKSKDAETDFISCTAFGKQGDFIAKNFVQGDNLIVEDGRIQTGSYVNKNGETVSTTEVIVNAVEFGENKASRDARRANQQGGQQGMPNNVVQMPTQVPQGMPMGAPVQQMPTAAPQGVPMGMPTGTPQMQAPTQAPPQTATQTPVPQTAPQTVVPQNPAQTTPSQTAPVQTVPQTAPAQAPAQTPVQTVVPQNPAQTVPSTPPQAPAQAPVPQAVGQTPFGVVPMGEVFH